MKSSAVVVLSLALLAGCGGDGGSDDPSDEEQIRALATRSLVQDDYRRDCNQDLSDRLVEDVYRSRARCLEVERNETDDNEATAADVEQIKVVGDQATADVTLHGGKTEGTTGAIAFVKEGGSWRFADLSPAFLRSGMNKGFEGADTEDLPAGANACMQKEFNALGDEALQDYAYAVTGERTEGKRQTFQFLARCKTPQGTSMLQETVEKSFTRKLREAGLPPDAIDCIVRKLRAGFDQDDLIEILSDPRGATRLRDAAAEAARECRPAPGGSA